MNEREEFEKWCSSHKHEYVGNIGEWWAWQAAKASSAKRIAELEAELAEQAKVLVANVDKQLELEEIALDRAYGWDEATQAWKNSQEDNVLLAGKLDSLQKQYDEEVMELKAKLEAMERQEPVGSYGGKEKEYGYHLINVYDDVAVGTKLYTHPPLRELSDEEILQVANEYFALENFIFKFARAIRER